MIQPRIGSYAIYEPDEEGWENWEGEFLQINQVLSDSGVFVIPAPEPIKDLESMENVARFFQKQAIDALHVLVITWSFDHYTIELHQRIQKPIIIRAIPGIRTGSIVGAQQLASVLSDLDVKHRIFYGELSDRAVIESISIYAKACAIVNRLYGARMGVIGRRTEGMTPTAVDEIEVLRLFGIRLIHYGLDEFLDISSQIPVREAEQVWMEMQSDAKKTNVQHKAGLLTAANYLTCQKIINQQGLDALTIGSYPKCQGTMCLPIAWLNQTGFPTGCEGDVNSTISMLILSQLSEAPIHFGEMLAIDQKTNTIVTSHCGCGSPSLADKKGFELTPVRLAHSGVCIRYSAKSGPVTFVNLVGRKNNYRLCAFEGQAETTDLVFEGNPLRFKLNISIEKIWLHLDQHSFGHHWMTVYAHVNLVLRELCRLLALRGVFPDLEE